MKLWFTLQYEWTLKTRYVKEARLETSPVAQRLRLCTPHAGGWGLNPGQGTRFHMPQLKIPQARHIDILFLPGLESNPESSLQTEEEARHPWVHSVGSKRSVSRLERKAESLLPLQASPDPPGESGMETRDPCLPLRGILGPGHTPRWGLFGPVVTRAEPPAFHRNSNWRLGFPGPTQEEAWNSCRFRESRCNSRKTTWFQRLHRMRPLPATASPGKSHVPSWSGKRYLAPLMRPLKFPETPGSLEWNT